MIKALLLTTCLFWLAGQVDAQTKISIHKKNISLRELIQLIADISGYHLSTRNELYRTCKDVTVGFDNLDVEMALKLCCYGQPVTFRLKNNTIFIEPSPVSGRVRGLLTGEPLGGVLVKGQDTSRKVITDAEGRFTLPRAALDEFISFEAPHMLSKKVKVRSRISLSVSLEEKVTTEDTVIVVPNGFEQLPDEQASGAAATLSNKELNNHPSRTVYNRLNATVAGVVTNTVGKSGNYTTSVKVRGNSTFLANKQALVIVDQFPDEKALDRINPNDIESITILKDAAATSIWGAQAGNGVIVITTRKGQYKKDARITVTANTTITSKPDSYYGSGMEPKDYLSTERYLFDHGVYNARLLDPSALVSPAVEIMARERDGRITSAEANAALRQLSRQDVRADYNKYFYKTGVEQQYAIGLRGGGEKNKYYYGAGYDRSLNGATGGHLQRMTLTANYTTIPLQSLELTTSVMLIRDQVLNDIPFPLANYPYDKLTGDDGSFLSSATGQRDSWKKEQPADLYNWSYRPRQELALRNDSLDSRFMRLLTTLHYEVKPGIKLSLSYQYRQEKDWHSNRIPVQSFTFRDLYNSFATIQGGIASSPIPVGQFLDWRKNDRQTQNIRLQLTTQHTWGDWSLNTQTGAEASGTSIDFAGGRRYPQPVDNNTLYPLYYTPMAAQIPGPPYEAGQTDNIRSLYTNAGLNFANRYVATVSARIDRSSAFGSNANRKTIPLWSAGLKWNIAREAFNKKDWINHLTLRLTYGFSGNTDPSTSPLLTTTFVGPNRYGANTATILNPANPDLRWEKIGLFNAGLDFGLFSSRLTGSIEWYRRQGNNLLNQEITRTTSGAIPYRGNTGALTAQGLEIQLQQHSTFGAVRWNSNLLVNYTTNKVIRYGDPGMKAWQLLESPEGNFRAGWPANALFAFPWAGLDSLGNPTGFLGGGTSKNYEGIMDRLADSLQFVGYSTPAWILSMAQTVRWRGFSLSFTVAAQLKYVFRKPAIDYSELSVRNGPGSADYYSRWQTPGDERRTNVPAMSIFATPFRDQFYKFASVNILPADNIRLREVRIGYTPGKKIKQWLHVSDINLYGYASNMGILWKAADTRLDPDSPTEIPRKPSYTFGITIEP